MSFLSELKKKKQKLKETETVVTNLDGQRYIEKGDSKTSLGLSYGFVVDTKPDDVPVLVVNNLYIGSQDCTASNVIEAYDIKHVLSLGINVEVKVNHKFVECLDLPETDIKPVLKECLPFVHTAVTSQENILVHCNAGVSRTSLVAIGYLMHYQNMSFKDAYSLVKAKRPAIQPNAGFKKLLMIAIPGQII